MKIHSVSCNNCGAPLEVEEGINYITCRFCNSRLEIKKSDSTHYTRVIEQLKADNKKMAKDVARLDLERELAELDRDWEKKQETIKINTRFGKKKPTKLMAGLHVFIALICGIVLTAFMSKENNGNEGLIFGFIAVIILLASALYTYTKSNEYNNQEKNYHTSRENLQQKIEEIRKKG